MMPGGCYEARATLCLKIKEYSVGIEALTAVSMVSLVKTMYELLEGT